MNNDLMFSSASCEWETPKDLFDKINRVFKFEFDLCANRENAKCERFFTKEDDGLAQDWAGTCWMNPPYGKDMPLWMCKARDSAIAFGSTIVCLVPARTDTKWWHNYCKDAEIYFLKGRLKFGNSKNAAPFPSAIVVFRPKIKDILG